MALPPRNNRPRHELNTSQWLSAFCRLPPHQKPPLLDLRPEALFDAQHVAHSSNFPLSPEHQLTSRTHQLPPPSAHPHIALYGPPHHCRQAALQLQRRGYAAPLVLTEQQLAALPRTRGPSRALWSPAPVLLQELPRLLALPARVALDIGCGSGRDAAFLASAGFSVTAVDRHRQLTRNATQLSLSNHYHPLLPPDAARARGSVLAITRTLGADLRADRRFLRAHAAPLLLVVRFLRRGVLQLLHEAVQPGGLLIYEHFLTGCERFGSPVKPSQMLRRAELAQLFGAQHNFIVLRDEQCTLPDGRPVLRFVARKRV